MMDTKDFRSEVRRIRLDTIEPSPDNPRGSIERDDSFQRLVKSIAEFDILVPLVVSKLNTPQGHARFRLVDGERRYWAARQLGKEFVPAHVLQAGYLPQDLRKFMFQLHMTREQWGPLAQCRSLSEAYSELDSGLEFERKAEWIDRLARETGMSQQTARDRINVLAWPKALKEKIYTFAEEEPTSNIYSYVLALEASVIEPSIRAFPKLYDRTSPTSPANGVRESLLLKTLSGLQTGVLRSREQIRAVSPLFDSQLTGDKKRVAQSIFQQLIGRPKFTFDDARMEITARLPEALKEKPPKPARLIANMRSLQRALREYDVSFFPAGKKGDSKTKLRSDFADAMDGLSAALDALRGQI